ncbi:MAG: FtsX-like permease family protein [Pseudomonadota bacterium]
MEIRPILSSILRNRLGAILVATQIAVTMAVLCNAGFLAFDRLQTMLRPTGLDVEHAFSVDVINFGDGFDFRADIPLDIEAIEAIDGVRAVTTINSIPLSGGGWGESLNTHLDEEAEDARDEQGNIYMIDEHGIDALGVALVAGRNFTAAEIQWREARSSDMPAVIIVTQAMADSLFPEGDAIGQTVYSGDNPMEIVGIVERMFGSWVSWDRVGNTMLAAGRNMGQMGRFIVRSEPGQLDAVMPLVEQALTERYPERVVRNVTSLKEHMAGSYADDRTAAVVLLVIICLLLIVTGLGIVGLVSFLVNQRTKQIGTRRALGAQRWDVVRYFLVENWLITSIGLSFGLILTSVLNYYLVQNFELPRLPLWYLPVGLMGIWALSLTASFGPARRAARVAPAIATRTV